MAKHGRLAPWTPLVSAYAERKAVHIEESTIAAMVADTGRSEAEIRAAYETALTKEHFVNSRYAVALDRQAVAGRPYVHLSIRRTDREPVGPERYRDFMLIKDQLVGPEVEAVELYPARSREVDSANQYHLWCVVEPGYRFPFGYRDRLVVATTSRASGTRQADFEPHHPH